MMSPTATLTSVVPPPLEVPDSGSMRAMVAGGSVFEVSTSATPSARAPLAPRTTTAAVAQPASLPLHPMHRLTPSCSASALPSCRGSAGAQSSPGLEVGVYTHPQRGLRASG